MSDSQKKQAQVTALRSLAASPKSRNELAKKLKDKGYLGSIIRETLDNLEKQGILNDHLYAQHIVERWVHTKPSGKHKIDFELKRKGIPEKIRQKLTEELDPDQEVARAKQMALIRWEKIKHLSREKRRKRLYDFLIRRGFDFQIVRETVEALEAGN